MLKKFIKHKEEDCYTLKFFVLSIPVSFPSWPGQP